MNSIGLNELGYEGRLYILAFDHRGSFEKMVGDVERVPGAKELIWEGFQKAIEEGAPKEFAGILVDAQYGTKVAQEAKAGGYKLAMPVEKSGQNEFDFEYGDQFGEKIEEFGPDFSKVLVRYNPDGDAEMNERQIVKLRRLSEWLTSTTASSSSSSSCRPSLHSSSRSAAATSATTSSSARS